MSEIIQLGHRAAIDKGIDWEPAEDERTWYRSSSTGNRGYLCRRSGRDMIRLDRPNDPTAIQVYEEQSWIVDREHRPLTSMACARVAQAADQVLCRALGLHDKAGKDWMSMTEKTRLQWMREGPSKPDIRRRLYLAIRATLAGLEA